ncbi:MAG: class I SAM-dependent methyltransferase [Luteimonas sp.]
MNTSPPVTFAVERLDIIAKGEAGHFWYGPRRALLLETIGRRLVPGARIVDVGCGTGGLVGALRDHGHAACGVDPWAARRGLDPAHFHVGQAEAIPLPDASVEAATAFDVLEHADDALALHELHRVLAPGGHLFLSVPAHAWLWSTRDALAGHRRRYTRAMLRQRVGAAGFAVERLFGYQFLLLPLFAASRAWSRLRGRIDTRGEDAPGRIANALLLAVNRLEVALGRWGRPPTGSSLVLVARKPAERPDGAPRWN